MTRILVVDDDVSVRRTLQMMLEICSYDVVAAHSASDAKQKLAGSTFDMMVTDLLLAGEDGIDLVETVRQGWPGLPIIGTTGDASLSDEARLRGAADVLHKPFRRGALMTSVRQRLSLS